MSVLASSSQAALVLALILLNPLAVASQPSEVLPAGEGVYPLVTLQTGRGPTCSAGNLHQWPVGMAAADCHGWRAIDPTGRLHDNSANNIQCNADGTFSFTQYAGNSVCQGSGVTKTYSLNACQRDIPPTLYTVAIDLTCCSHPDAPECRPGIPSVTVPGATIFFNGRQISP